MLKKLLILIIVAVLLSLAAIFVVPAIARQFIPLDYEDYIKTYSDKYGVPEHLIAAVIMAESSFRPSAKSSAGAVGLMQLTPDTLYWLFSKTPEKEEFGEEALSDPETNIKYGTLNLALLAESYEDESCRYAAYNAGRGKVSAWLRDSRYSDDGKTLKEIPYKETDGYVKKIMLYKKIYKYLYYSKD